MPQDFDASLIRIHVTFPEEGTLLRLEAPKDCPTRIVVMALWTAVMECARVANRLVDAEAQK